MKGLEPAIRRLLSGVALLAAAGALAACGGDDENTAASAGSFQSDGKTEKVDDVHSFSSATTEGGEAAEEPFEVHFAQYWTGTPVLAAFRDHLRDAAKDYPHIKLSVSDAENDPTKLVADIEAAVARQVDAIIVNAGDGTTPVPGVERAEQAGIPVIAMQKKIESESVDVTAVADDEEQGRAQGEALVAELEKRNDGTAEGQVIVVNGIPGASLTVEQNRGFESALSEHQGIKVVCDQPGNFARADAVRVLENCLQAHPGADAVWYLGADVGSALASTVKSAGKADDVFIIGGGGNREALEVLANDGPIAYDQVFPSAAVPALAATDRLLRGEKVPREITIHAPGVDAENVDEYLQDDEAYVRWPVDLPAPWQ